MTMPWLCSICGSDQSGCGHREPELVALFADPDPLPMSVLRVRVRSELEKRIARLEAADRCRLIAPEVQA